MKTPCFQHDSYRRDCGDCRDMSNLSLPENPEPHVHKAQQDDTTGELLDWCALCGRDIRDTSVHIEGRWKEIKAADYD